jgi:hypothetical protein
MPIRLGALIEQVERLKPETTIRFDFGYTTPREAYSYRGFYDNLAIEFETGIYDKYTAADFLKLLQSSRYKEIHGYKGGTYFTTDSTPVWVVGDRSQSTGTAVKGVRDLGYGYAIIETEYEQ